jgi:hypothetical protein
LDPDAKLCSDESLISDKITVLADLRRVTGERADAAARSVPKGGTGMRRASLLFAFVFLLLPSTGWAHRHKAALEGAYQGAHRSNIDGFAFAFELPFCKKWYEAKGNSDDGREGTPSSSKTGTRSAKHTLWCEVTHPISILAGVSYINGPHGEANEERDLKQLAITAGPRFTHELGSERWQSSVHVLLGAIREDLGEGNEWSFAGSVGIGLEFTLLGHAKKHSWELYAGPRLDVSWIAGRDGDVFPEWSFAIGVRMP